MNQDSFSKEKSLYAIEGDLNRICWIQLGVVSLPALGETRQEELCGAGKLKIVCQMLMEPSIRHQIGSQSGREFKRDERRD